CHRHLCRPHSALVSPNTRPGRCLENAYPSCPSDAAPYCCGRISHRACQVSTSLSTLSASPFARRATSASPGTINDEVRFRHAKQLRLKPSMWIRSSQSSLTRYPTSGPSSPGATRRNWNPSAFNPHELPQLNRFATSLRQEWTRWDRRRVAAPRSHRERNPDVVPGGLRADWTAEVGRGCGREPG